MAVPHPLHPADRQTAAEEVPHQPKNDSERKEGRREGGREGGSQPREGRRERGEGRRVSMMKGQCHRWNWRLGSPECSMWTVLERE